MAYFIEKGLVEMNFMEMKPETLYGLMIGVVYSITAFWLIVGILSTEQKRLKPLIAILWIGFIIYTLANIKNILGFSRLLNGEIGTGTILSLCFSVISLILLITLTFYLKAFGMKTESLEHKYKNALAFLWLTFGTLLIIIVLY